MDGDKDSLLLDERFSFLIAVRLIRDNWKAITGNYPTSLIGEIWFDLQDKQLLRIILLPLFVRFCLIWFNLQDKQLLRIILLPLLVRFCLIYRIWAIYAVRVIGPWGG